MVKTGQYTQRIDHYGLLRMVEGAYGLPLLNESEKAAAVKGMWLK
jgi:acid phosphatase